MTLSLPLTNTFTSHRLRQSVKRGLAPKGWLISCCLNTCDRMVTYCPLVGWMHHTIYSTVTPFIVMFLWHKRAASSKKSSGVCPTYTFPSLQWHFLFPTTKYSPLTVDQNFHILQKSYLCFHVFNIVCNKFSLPVLSKTETATTWYCCCKFICHQARLTPSWTEQVAAIW